MNWALGVQFMKWALGVQFMNRALGEQYVRPAYWREWDRQLMQEEPAACRDQKWVQVGGSWLSCSWIKGMQQEALLGGPCSASGRSGIPPAMATKGGRAACLATPLAYQTSRHRRQVRVSIQDKPGHSCCSSCRWW